MISFAAFSAKLFFWLMPIFRPQGKIVFFLLETVEKIFAFVLFCFFLFMLLFHFFSFIEQLICGFIITLLL